MDELDDAPPPDPGDLRRTAAYGRRRAAWAIALDDPMTLLEAGVATRRFVRSVVHRELHWATDPDSSRHLPHGAEVVALDHALGVIFGDALRPGLFEVYLAELAFGEQMGWPLRRSYVRRARILAGQNLTEALDAAGLDAWAWGVRDGDFRRVCRRPAAAGPGGGAAP